MRWASSSILPLRHFFFIFSNVQQSCFCSSTNTSGHLDIFTLCEWEPVFFWLRVGWIVFKMTAFTTSSWAQHSTHWLCSCLRRYCPSRCSHLFRLWHVAQYAGDHGQRERGARLHLPALWSRCGRRILRLRQRLRPTHRRPLGRAGWRIGAHQAPCGETRKWRGANKRCRQDRGQSRAGGGGSDGSLKGLTLCYPECTALSAAWGMGGEQ